MADNVASRVLDNGLSVLDTEADKVFICSQEPTTYAEASATYALGVKAFAVGAVFGAPAAGSPNGRKVSSAAITDGSVTATGTATHVAVVDSVNSRLLAVTSLLAPQAVTSGNLFTLGSWDVRLPSQ
jgi:hypothetical protein